MGRVILITGGARSGKSTFALQLASQIHSGTKNFIATAIAFDDEMKLRIENHKSERGPQWKTIESPYDLSDAISEIPQHNVSVVDCCTVWLGNIWFKYGDSDDILSLHINKLTSSVTTWKDKLSGTLIFVTNEVGWGIIPPDSATRRYRDWAGRLNQNLAGIASEVYLCVSGIPMVVKKKEILND